MNIEALIKENRLLRKTIHEIAFANVELHSVKSLKDEALKVNNLLEGEGVMNLKWPNQMSGLDFIIKERMEQLEKHNWSLEHDAMHKYGEMSSVAAALCVCTTDVSIDDPVGFIENGLDVWGLVKKHEGDRVSQLKIAGALIAAEIDRILNPERGVAPDAQ